MGAVAFKDLITFTRASGGGRFNSQGQYEWLPANQPRIDYDPVTGECRGLLIEEQRTNLLTYSSDFANAVWVKDRATVEPAAVLSPDGSANAFLLRESTAAGLHNTGRGSLSVGQGKQYTASVFAKSFSGNRVLRFALFGAVANINLDTLEHNAFGSSALTVVTSKAANGFTRVAITVTASADSSMYLSMAQNISTASNNYTGDGTSGIYIWGAQLEAGSSPTSYIPTTTAQVTRAADIARVNTLSPWFNAGAGTLFVEAVRTHPLASGGANLIDLGDGTYDERIYLALNAANNNSFSGDWRSSNLSPDYFVNTSPKWAPGVTARAAIAWGADRVAAAQGSIVKTSTSTVVPGVTKMGIGKPVVGSGGELNGHVKQIRYYPKRLSDTELQALTA